MPTFKQLTSHGYRHTQRARVLATAARVDTRDDPTTGRVIPDAEDLAINEGRHLQAAVLFLDISEFCRRPQETQHQQSLILKGLSLFFTEMVRVIEDFGGTVEKNTGDGLMAYFVSKPDEQAGKELRAVAASITMFDVAEIVIDELLVARSIEPLRFRICIDSGSITVARMGAAQRFNGIVAIGTTANLACKMLNIAKAGELMIGNNVARELPSDWQIYLRPSDHVTGYHYVSNGSNYNYWYYTGRWIR